MHMRHLFFLITAAGIAACGSEPLIYPQLELAPASAAGLAAAEGETLAAHIKNGMRLQLREYSQPRGGGWGWGGAGASAPPSPTPTPTPGSGSSSSGGSVTPGGGFSGTNVHVAGVDEADIVKYDGEHWFIAAPAGGDNFQIHPHPQILVAQLDAQAPGGKFVAELTFEDTLGIAEMYLLGADGGQRQLAVMRQRSGNVAAQLPAWGGSFSFYRHYPENGQLELALVDVSEPRAPSVTSTIAIDGNLIDSRRIGDTLYLATRYDPWLAPLVYDNGQSERREANEAALVEAPLALLMPSITDSAGERPLTETCLLPADRESHHGFAPMVFVTAIDLATGELRSSVCISAQASGLSMFSESLYVTGLTSSGDTVLHKFAVSGGGLEYTATGEIGGNIVNGRSDPAFRLDERHGRLRVVSTGHGESFAGIPVPGVSIASGGPVHRLTVLEQQGARLVAVAELPNPARPEPIGKPFEDIYSVRFEDDMAYLVTFRRTDPLYAIDLSDPLDPKIAGELEIPGYASYMHPLSGDYLFTLGMNADESGFVEGLKFELVKVEGGQPRVVDQVLLPNAYSSEALQNLRALSVLQVSEQQYRFALPVQQRAGEGGIFHHDEHALQLLAVDLAEEQLHDRGQLAGGVSQSRVQRGLLQDDAVFYASGRHVLAAPFAAPERAVEVAELPRDEVCGPAQSSPSFVLSLKLADAEWSSCPGLEVVHRVGVTRDELALAGELDGGSCVYRGPTDQFGLFTAILDHPGYYGFVLPIEVYAQACDIVAVEEQVVLTPLPMPVPCTTEVLPSITVLVEMPDEGDACAAEVTVFNQRTLALHTLSGELVTGAMCQYSGPYEQEGLFTVTATAAGYRTQTVTAFVGRDICHVVTQEFTMVMEVDPAAD